jgi:hypothetical protein
MAGSRETTPEQFEGMDEGRSRFKEVAESSEGDDSADDGPRKRTKVDATDATAAPKWSNPDPYTVLPPPETLGAPKKDIVQTIRKAKNDQAAKVDKVADNSDFISFNFDGDGRAITSSRQIACAHWRADVQPPRFFPPHTFHHQCATEQWRSFKFIHADQPALKCAGIDFERLRPFSPEISNCR